jgi:hypothetical protein
MTKFIFAPFLGALLGALVFSCKQQTLRESLVAMFIITVLFLTYKVCFVTEDYVPSDNDQE